MVAGLAAVSLTASALLWRRAERMSLEEAIKTVVQIAFGENALSSDDLERFATDLSPLLIGTFPATYLIACQDWAGQVAPNGVEALDETARARARSSAEQKPAQFASFIATHLVMATGYAFDTQIRPQPYFGLMEEWPSPRALTCPPLADFSMEDGWPV